MVVTYSDDFDQAAQLVRRAEEVGVDLVSVAEAYSFDSVSRLGYLAAVTTRMTIAAGILPMYSRTPTLIGMTAAGLDDVSGGRFELGLGASGPQVIEGFHGVAYDRPLAHVRETVEICRALWRREPIAHEGSAYRIPLPADQGTGLGKPLKLINRPRRERIPISIAALAPRGVAQAAEIGDGWLPLFYWPERAAQVWGESLALGAGKRDAALGPLDVHVQAPLAIEGTGVDLDAALDAHRAHLALYVGGMGAPGANFYNELAASYGFPDEAARVQELYLAGERGHAAAALPDELVRGTALIGTETEVAARVAALRTAGVTTLTVTPADPATAVDQFAAARALLDAG